MKKVQWAILGCGNVTEVKSGPGFNKVPDSQIVAVMRRNGELAKDYAQRHGINKYYDDADKLINDPDVNAIYVATPPDTHAEYTIKAARAGKAVYVEKPMARNYAECEKMLAACDQANVPLFVAYYRRTLPDFLKIKQLIDQGSIGDIRFVSIELFHPVKDDLDRENLPWRVVPEIAGGGYFFDLASHQLDYLDYILGPIESATGTAANLAGDYPAEDTVSAQFKFESGILGTGMWCFAVAPSAKTDRTQIVGTKGRIIFSSFDVTPVILETENGTEQFEIPRPQHVQQPLIQTVVDDLLGKGSCPSTGASAARTSKILDDITSHGRVGP